MDISNIVAAFRGMHLSHAKHSYAWPPRKCDHWTDRQTDRWTDRETDAGQSDPYVPLCFASDTINWHDKWFKLEWLSSAIVLYLSSFTYMLYALLGLASFLVHKILYISPIPPVVLLKLDWIHFKIDTFLKASGYDRQNSSCHELDIWLGQTRYCMCTYFSATKF